MSPERTQGTERATPVDARFIGKDGQSVSLAARDCVLVSYCRLDSRQVMALFRNGDKLALLADCDVWVSDGWHGKLAAGDDDQLAQVVMGVSASLRMLEHLDCEELEAALAQTGEYASSGRAVRLIDNIAFELVRRFRPRPVFPAVMDW